MMCSEGRVVDAGGSAMEAKRCMSLEQFIFFLNEDPARAEAYEGMPFDEKERFLKALNVCDDAVEQLLRTGVTATPNQLLRIICWPF
jgi:hypothetical protein